MRSDGARETRGSEKAVFESSSRSNKHASEMQITSPSGRGSSHSLQAWIENATKERLITGRSFVAFSMHACCSIRNDPFPIDDQYSKEKQTQVLLSCDRKSPSCDRFERFPRYSSF